MAAEARQPTISTARSAGAFRLSMRGAAIVATLLGLVVIYATDQVLPASTDRQAELRFWLAARATGIVAFVLLTLQVTIGLVLSHPHNKTTWKLSKRIFPWHDHLWVFVVAFLAAHIVSLVADPKAGVSLAGAFIPGLSQYRSAPVALGTLALYAFLVTALTARHTKLLPPGTWLSLHRLALLIFVLSWLHGMLAGTDSGPLLLLYLFAGAVITIAAAYRYWASREMRPSFSTSHLEGTER
jgi:sulfoxide reductase heme-binding subunit YedZ